MSVIGRNVGVLGVGMSCQTSFRIKAEAGLIARLTGDDAVLPVSTPFDWTVASPAAVGRLFDMDRFVPEAAELSLVEGRLAWKDAGVFYWHEKSGLSPAAVASFREKYAYREANLRRFRSVRQLFIVISNVQNDLDSLARSTGSDIQLNRTALRELHRALRLWFRRRFNYVVVSRPDRIRAQPFTGLTLVGSEGSSWKGDPQEWRGLLKQSLAPAPPQP
jgi:hypothetical protein